MQKSAGTTGMACLFLTGMLSFLITCSSVLTEQAPVQEEEKAKEVTMNPARQTQQMEAESPAIPSIDEEAPTIVEIASFGLG